MASIVSLQPENGTGRVPTSRVPIACEPCRTNKTRCRPSGSEGMCKRCFRVGLDCVVRSDRHPKRVCRRHVQATDFDKTPRSSCQFSPAAQNCGVDCFLDLPALEYPDVVNEVAMLGSNHAASFDEVLSVEEENNSKDGMPDPSSCPYDSESQKSVSSSLVSTICQRGLSLERAKELFSSFRDMSIFFPFVVIPTTASVQSMAKDHPFLLLAVLTAASCTDVELHHQLDHEFRRVLGVKVMADSQRSLDFLQGLLVYISWYPTYLKFRQQQVRMYTSLALSIASDLGLNQHSHASLPFDYDSEQTLSSETQRAFLGCFYISSSISDIYAKSNCLKYDENLRQYGENLTCLREYPSDVLLLPIVESQNICDRFRDYQQPDSLFPYNNTPAFDSETMATILQFEIDTWRTSLPSEVSLSPDITLMSHFMNCIIYSHELIIIRPSKRQQSWISSSLTHLSISDLKNSLSSAKKFLEVLFSQPLSQFKYLTCILWGRVVQIIVLLSRLSFPIPRQPAWDANDAREYAPLGMYLDCLCHRLGNLSQTKSTTSIPTLPDGPYIFKMVLEKLKESHERRVAQCVAAHAQVSTSTDPIKEKPHCPMTDRSFTTLFDVWDSSRDDILRDLEVGVNPATMGYHDIWATMTMGWARSE